MRTVGIVGSAVLSLILGAVPAFTQQDEKHDQDERHDQQQQSPEKKEQNAPGAKQQEHPDANRPAQNDKERQEMDRRQQENDRHPQGQEQNQQQNTVQQEDRRGVQQQDRQDQREDRRNDQRMEQGQDVRRGQAQGHREVTHGQRIPQERFRSSFGREHHFRINRPVIVEGSPQFVYSGYTFLLSEPWPAEWAYTDDYYVDYIDDTYYLYDAYHPGIQIALIIE